MAVGAIKALVVRFEVETHTRASGWGIRSEAHGESGRGWRATHGPRRVEFEEKSRPMVGSSRRWQSPTSRAPCTAVAL